MGLFLQWRLQRCSQSSRKGIFSVLSKKWSPIKNFKCILVCDEGYILDHDHLDDPKFDNPKRARNKIYCMTSKKGHKWKPGNPERFGRCVPDESIHCLNTPNFDEVDFYLTSSRKRFSLIRCYHQNWCKLECFAIRCWSVVLSLFCFAIFKKLHSRIKVFV